MTVQPMRLASWIAAEPMPEPPAWTRIVSPGSSLALSNSMCSTVPKVTGATAAPIASTPGGAGTSSRAGRLIFSCAKPSRWKPCTPLTFSQRLSRPLAAGPAQTAGARAVDRDQLARRQAGDARADRLDLAGGLRADHQRQLALGEGHAAPAPDVDVVERDRLDAQRHLAMRGRRRRRDVDRSSLRSSISCSARIRWRSESKVVSGDKVRSQRQWREPEPVSEGRSLPLRPVPAP